MTKQTSQMKPPTHEQNTVTVSRKKNKKKKTTVGVKPVLFARNRTLNSDAAPNYKHTLDRIGVLCLICETT